MAARFCFDFTRKDAYKNYMHGLVPRSVPRRLPRSLSVTAHFKKSLLRTRQAASTFELAYQAHIAVDRIRFAIRQTDQLAANQPVLQEVGMQLLDALDRLETADRHFQESFRLDRFRLENSNAGLGTSEIAREQLHRHEQRLSGQSS